MQPLEAGEPRTIGAYRLLGRLGAGGMGRVYLGRSAGGRTVAVKIVHPHFASDEEFRARFRREVEAARRVGGEWTAPVLDADPDAPVPWVATGYVAGPSLDRAVASHGPLPQACVRAVGAGLARALVAVHGLGLVHRDVKPSNVMLTLDGPRLIDFGIARATDGTASLTSTGVSIGSPGYMSPEQILGKGVTAAADVFSLGAVLAFAASGRPPSPGTTPPPSSTRWSTSRRSWARSSPGSCASWSPPAWPRRPPTGRSRGPSRTPSAARSAPPAGCPRRWSRRPAGPPWRCSTWRPAPPGPRGSGSRCGSRIGGPLARGRGVPGVPFGAGAVHGLLLREPGGRRFRPGGRLVRRRPLRQPRRERRGLRPRRRRAAADRARGPGGRAPGLRQRGGPALQLHPRPRGGRGPRRAVRRAVRDGAAARPGGRGQEPGRRRRQALRLRLRPGPGGQRRAGSHAPKGTRADVPKELTGTWKGTVTTARLGVATEFEITIRSGRVGEVVGRDKSVLDVLGTDCGGDWKLASATDRSLVLDTSGNTNPAPGICSGGSADERFTLNENGTLHYKSGDGPAGNPEGDLTRSP